ncbi:MAG TPA: DoxX family protein [Chloroflexia bacterium]
MEDATQLKTESTTYRTLRYLTLVSRLVLGVIFALAGLAKLGLPFAMAESIRAYEMGLPPFMVDFMANVLPPVELGVGIWLLMGLFTRFSAGITAALMVVFTIAVTQAWVRGLDINCGCFGGPMGADASTTPAARAIIGAMGPVGVFLTNEKADLMTIGRDLVFLLMSIHLILVPSVFSIDQLRQSRRQPTYEEDTYYDEDEAYEKADDSRELEDEHRPGQRVRVDGLDAGRP